jgi:hypothetical protein
MKKITTIVMLFLPILLYSQEYIIVDKNSKAHFDATFMIISKVQCSLTDSAADFFNVRKNNSGKYFFNSKKTNNVTVYTIQNQKFNVRDDKVSFGKSDDRISVKALSLSNENIKLFLVEAKEFKRIKATLQKLIENKNDSSEKSEISIFDRYFKIVEYFTIVYAPILLNLPKKFTFISFLLIIIALLVPVLLVTLLILGLCFIRPLTNKLLEITIVLLTIIFSLLAIFPFAGVLFEYYKNVLAILISLVLHAIVAYLYIKKATVKIHELRCNKCKAMFTMKKVGSRTIDGGATTIKEKATETLRNRSGQIIGTREKDIYVPGRRMIHKRDFTCKKCGYEITLRSSYSVKN